MRHFKFPLACASVACALLPAVMQAQATCAVGTGTVPAGWSLFGPGGGASAASAPGIDTPIPLSQTSFCWIATEAGTTGRSTVGVPDAIAGSTKGAYVRSSTFSGGVGDQINFYFNFLTNDGTGQFVDWARARLLFAGSGSQAALIFTAQTGPSNQVVPGAGFVSPNATLTPGTATLQGNLVTLDGYQYGPCRYPNPMQGCGTPGLPGGSAGWVQATYALQSAGSYQLEFGVSDYGDEAYPSALAFLGASITREGGGEEVIGTPEPASLTLVVTGLVGLAGFARRRRDARG